MALAIILDQCKSLGILTILYVVIVRRFGYLQSNESDYLTPAILETPKNEVWIPKLKVFCLKMLESTAFETLSMILISFYTIFILFWLTMADIFNIDE